MDAYPRGKYRYFFLGCPNVDPKKLMLKFEVIRNRAALFAWPPFGKSISLGVFLGNGDKLGIVCTGAFLGKIGRDNSTGAVHTNLDGNSPGLVGSVDNFGSTEYTAIA